MLLSVVLKNNCPAAVPTMFAVEGDVGILNEPVIKTLPVKL